MHRLLRGAGLQGLRGIAERRPIDDGTFLVRPLLHVTRDDLIDYLHDLGQDSREDSSNSDLRYTRNRIRRELLPHLEAGYNPAVVSVLGRLAEQAAEAHHHVESEAAALLRAAEMPRAGSMVVLAAARLTLAPRLLLRVVFRLVWAREEWPTGRMDFAAWERLAGLVFDGANGGDFPGGVRAQPRDRVIQLEGEGREAAPAGEFSHLFTFRDPRGAQHLVQSQEASCPSRKRKRRFDRRHRYASGSEQMARGFPALAESRIRREISDIMSGTLKQDRVDELRTR